jgi:hypothetical protein
MLFEFFRRKDNPPKEPDEPVSASICYYMKPDGSGPYINIQLSDYDDDSIASLCELLDTLAEETCYMETIEMIKSSLIKDNQEELLIKIFTHISRQVREKILNGHKESLKDEPCIRPSDMV